MKSTITPALVMLDRFTSTLRIGLFVLALAFAAPTTFAQSGSEAGDNASAVLSSEDVSEKEVGAAAEVIVTMQMHRQEMQMKMRQKYGNPQEMDSTQRREARRRIMKERQTLMQEKTQEENLSAERLGLIMKSARQDSTLRKRLKTTVQEKRRDEMAQRPGTRRGESSPGDDGNKSGDADGKNSGLR